MLILTRRIQETLIIDGDIEVTVLGIKGGQVRLGVKAPSEVTVDRKEIHLRKEREQREINLQYA